MPENPNRQWTYVPPLVHLGICLIATSYVVPGLQFLGILWSIITIADIPVSLVTAALAFSRHGALAATWATIIGTLWWYLLCRIAEILGSKLRQVFPGMPTR